MCAYTRGTPKVLQFGTENNLFIEIYDIYEKYTLKSFKIQAVSLDTLVCSAQSSIHEFP